MKIDLFKKIFAEGPGDFAGSDSLQGGPFGYGGNRQLANPVKNPKIIDPKQEEKDHILKLPIPIMEREASDILYRDLPGNVPPNSLVNKVAHIPIDPKDQAQQTNMSRVSLSSLISSPKQEKWGYGPLTPTKFDSESTNNWKETSGENMLPVDKDGVGVELVKKVDWLSPDNLDPLSGFNRLNDEDDVNTRAGSISQLVAPKKQIPEPAPVYEENKKMKAKESKKLNDLENKKDHDPEKTPVGKVVGTGLGSVVKTKEHIPQNDKPKSKPVKQDKQDNLNPYKGSSEVLVDPESFTLIKETIEKTIKEFFEKQNRKK